MLRNGCALLLVAVWSLPVSAEEPDFETDLQVEVELQLEVDAELETELEFTTLELVDPFVGGEEELMTFGAEAETEILMIDGGIADTGILMFEEHVDGEFCPEGHTHEECHEFVDGACVEADCFWMRARDFDNEVVADGEELFMFTLSGNVEDNVAIQTFGGPSLPAAAIEHAQGVPFEASLNVGRASEVQPVVGLGIETAAAATAQAQTNEPGLLDRIFSGGNEPAAVSDADRDYASQLVAIDELRDRALETGDASLLQQADRMEAQLKVNTRAGFRFFGN